MGGCNGDIGEDRLRTPASMVYVFYTEISVSLEDQLKPLTRFLSSEEQSRAARFVFPKDRALFIAAHGLLRSRLIAVTGFRHLEFQSDRYGKPALHPPFGDPPLLFNLSHTNGLAACVLAGGYAVGIDTEEVVPRHGIEEIARWAFTEQERRIVAGKYGDDRLDAFYRLWTLKEALAKGIGRGLGVNLQDIEFSLEPPSLRLLAGTGEDAAYWRVKEFAPTRKHRMAVAVKVPPADTFAVSVQPVALDDLAAGGTALAGTKCEL
jgi:4'-phosphopantetheinyl transferase